MKKSILIIIFFITLCAKAQGNLQFNKVKLVTTIETVPVGKVWKVESILYSSLPIPFRVYGTPPYYVNPNNFEDIYINVNGSPIITRSVRANNNTSFTSADASMYFTVYECKLPLWLPSGTTLEKTAPIAYISVIEFNITQ